MNKRKWNERKLSDIATMIDYRGKTPQKSSRGIPLITAKIVKNGTILPANEFIAENQYASWMTRGYPCVGDVVMTTEAPLGEVAQLRDAHVALAQRIITIRGKKDVLDNGYLKYFLQSAEGQGRLRARETGTTVTGIKAAELRELMIPLPDIVQQRKISKVLLDLDEKIYNLTQINHNLEEQAALIFADWLQGCNESVAIGDLSTNILDYTPINNGFVRLLNSSDVTEGVFPDIQLVPNANLKGHFKKRFQLGDILYSEIRPRNHHYGFVLFDASEYIASTRLMVIRALDYKVSPAMLYQYLLLPNVEAEFTLKTESRSGTFPQGNYADMASIKIPYAPVKAQNEVSSTLTKIRQTIANNQLENRQLSELRDALLPKLMSGELDISEVQV